MILLCVMISVAAIMVEYGELDIFREHPGLREGMLYSNVANNLGFMYLAFKYLSQTPENTSGKLPYYLRGLVNQFVILTATSAIVCLMLIVFGGSILVDGRDDFEQKLLIVLLIINTVIGFIMWWKYSRLQFTGEELIDN